MKSLQMPSNSEKIGQRIVSLSVTAILFAIVLNFSAVAYADDFSKTIDTFKKSPAVQPFFRTAYGYAVFPVIGKGGLGVGGAYGKGQVYQSGKVTGFSTVLELSVGWQAGGQALSEVIFFQDKRAYDEFVSGSFEFGAEASAVAITAGAEAQAGTQGATAGASAGPHTGKQFEIGYNKGMAVFVHAKGGLMYEAAIAGQKFGFTPKKNN